MRYRRLLTSAICLIGGFVLMGQAEAQIAWFGYSELCFEGTFKGGSVTNGELTITLLDVEIRVACLNTQSTSESCQPGGGNTGDITVVVPASADPTKEKGTIFANGCIPLDRWDHHFLDNGGLNPDHQHICLPVTNPNKFEIPDTAFIPQINTEWVLTNKDKIIARGNQTCFWDGFVDPATCKPCTAVNPDDPACKNTFTCPIDEMFKK